MEACIHELCMGCWDVHGSDTDTETETIRSIPPHGKNTKVNIAEIKIGDEKVEKYH